MLLPICCAGGMLSNHVWKNAHQQYYVRWWEYLLHMFSRVMWGKSVGASNKRYWVAQVRIGSELWRFVICSCANEVGRKVVFLRVVVVRKIQISITRRGVTGEKFLSQLYFGDNILVATQIPHIDWTMLPSFSLAYCAPVSFFSIWFATRFHKFKTNWCE